MIAEDKNNAAGNLALSKLTKRAQTEDDMREKRNRLTYLLTICTKRLSHHHDDKIMRRKFALRAKKYQSCSGFRLLFPSWI